MRLKTKNIVRTPKQSLFFFIFIMTLILGSLIYIFVKNRTSSLPKSLHLPKDFYNNVKNEIEEDAQSIESDIKTEIEEQSTPIPPSVKRISQPINNQPKKQPKQNIPISANSSNPSRDVDPWQFISHLPSEDTRLQPHNREKTNDYFLEGISITPVHSGTLEQPYETENFRGGEGFTYIN